ncbi:MAG: oligosaccharide flippase family protein [Candidatus Acetothermia bacterium]|nr:oligosaccharide flippase family protein [Candidatus Acetothermia bacterium]MDH7506121.1 oligosaccharide flippase family protein [Candidatus Acetothermia bacterium]
MINFAAIAVYTRLLSPMDYGRYSLVLAGVGLCNLVFFQWLRVSLLRFLPAHVENPRELLSAILSGFSAVGLFVGFMGPLLAWLWPDLTWRGLIGLAVPLLWAEAWFELNLELARSKLQPLRYGLMSGLKAASSLGLGALLVLSGLRTYGPLTGLLLGALLAGVGLSWPEWKGVRPLASSRLLPGLLRYGLPLTTTFALGFVISTSDRFIIAWFLGEGPAGVYAAGYDLGQQPLILLMTVVNLAAYPLAVRALEHRGTEAAQAQVRKNATLLLAVAVPGAVGLAVLAPNIAGVLLGAGFREEGALILPWVAFAILMSGVRAYHFDLAFQLGRRTIGQVWVVGPAAALNFVLNLWWIPSLGILGAVYATAAAYLVALGLSAGLGRKVFVMRFPYAEAAKIMLATGIMAGALWPTLTYRGALPLAEQVFLGCLVYGIAALVLNVGGGRAQLLSLLRRVRA